MTTHPRGRSTEISAREVSEEPRILHSVAAAGKKGWAFELELSERGFTKMHFPMTLDT